MAGVALLLTLGASGCDSSRLDERAAPVAVHRDIWRNATTTTTLPRSARAARSRPARVALGSALPAPVGDLLDRLAHCESQNNPKAVGGKGAFYGAFQFMPRTWWALTRGTPWKREYFGAVAAEITDKSYAEQKAVAARIPVSAWGRQFPVCGPRALSGGGGSW